MWSSIYKTLFRRKTFDPSSETIETAKLNRCMTLFDLTFLGIGATMGVGIYVLAGAVAKDTAGPSVVLSFLVAGVASSLSGLCYAELGSRVPKAGSAYVYSYVTVGEIVGFVIGWNLILEYAIGTASVARGYSGYLDSLTSNRTMANAFQTYLPMNIPHMSPYPDLCAFLITLLLTLVLSWGVKSSTRLNNIFTCLNICVVVFVTFFGLCLANVHNWNIKKEELPDEKYGSGGWFPYGISGTLAGAATCFYGYVGFDTIATSGEEAQNPQRNIPLAIIISLSFVFIAYCGISSSLTLMVPYYLQDSTAPLPYAFHETGWTFAGYIVTGGALFGLSTSLLGAMFPLPRILYAMSSDGLLFKFLAHIHPGYQTPFRATVLAGFLSGTMAAMFELKNLVDMMSIGTLMAYTMVAVAVVVLRYQSSDKNANHDYIALSPNKKLLEDTDDQEDSDEEIVYCSENNQILPTNDPPLPDKKTYGFWKLLLCPWKSDQADHISSSVASLLTFITNFTSFILALILAHSKQHHNIMSISIILFSIIVFCTFWTYLLPTENQKLAFKVPCVPWLPNLSIFINLYLMLRLSIATWVRFSVWMAIGAAIYIGYGIRNSTEGKKNKF